MMHYSTSAYYLLLFCLSTLLTQPVPAQVIRGSTQIAIKPAHGLGYIGDEFAIACSSQSHEPNVNPGVRWSVVKGNDTQSMPLATCPSFMRKPVDIECSPGVWFIPLYSFGTGTFSVSKISYQAHTLPVRIICQFDNEMPLEVTLSLSSLPLLYNLHIACNNNQSELSWQVRSAMDYFEASVLPEVWHRSNETTYPIGSPSSFLSMSMAVRAVLDGKRGPEERIMPFSRQSDGPSLRHVPSRYLTSCSSMYFRSEHGSDFSSVTFLITINGKDYINQVNQTLAVGLDIPDTGSTRLRTRIQEYWACEDRNCTQSAASHCRDFGEQAPGYAFYGKLQNLSFSCEDQRNQTLYIHLAWKHQLLSRRETDYDDSFYEIVATGDSGTAIYNTTISTQEKIPANSSNEPYTQYQSFGLEVEKGSSYNVTITPVYPVFFQYQQQYQQEHQYDGEILPFEAHCERQSISFELVIPGDTRIEQVNGESVLVLSGGVSSGYQITLSSQDAAFTETEYIDETGEQDMLIDQLEPGKYYTAVISYNGTDTTPCRTDTVNFSLAESWPESPSASFPDSSSVFAIPTSAALPESPSPADDGRSEKEHNRINIIVYSIDGAVYLTIIGLIIVSCAVNKRMNKYKRMNE